MTWTQRTHLLFELNKTVSVLATGRGRAGHSNYSSLMGLRSHSTNIANFTVLRVAGIFWYHTRTQIKIKITNMRV